MLAGFAAEDRTLYKMCTQRSPYNWSEQLYQRHGEVRAASVARAVLFGVFCCIFILSC